MVQHTPFSSNVMLPGLLSEEMAASVTSAVSATQVPMSQHELEQYGVRVEENVGVPQSVADRWVQVRLPESSVITSLHPRLLNPPQAARISDVPGGKVRVMAPTGLELANHCIASGNVPYCSVFTAFTSPVPVLVQPSAYTSSAVFTLEPLNRFGESEPNSVRTVQLLFSKELPHVWSPQ